MSFPSSARGAAWLMVGCAVLWSSAGALTRALATPCVDIEGDPRPVADFLIELPRSPARISEQHEVTPRRRAARDRIDLAEIARGAEVEVRYLAIDPEHWGRGHARTLMARVEELAHELPAYWQRLVVRPGLTGFAQVRRGYETSMAEKLAAETIAASKGEGNAVKKKEDTHRMAEANKAFAHYRW